MLRFLKILRLFFNFEVFEILRSFEILRFFYIRIFDIRHVQIKLIFIWFTIRAI